MIMHEIFFVSAAATGDCLTGNIAIYLPNISLVTNPFKSIFIVIVFVFNLTFSRYI